MTKKFPLPFQIKILALLILNSKNLRVCNGTMGQSFSVQLVRLSKLIQNNDIHHGAIISIQIDTNNSSLPLVSKSTN